MLGNSRRSAILRSPQLDRFQKQHLIDCRPPGSPMSGRPPFLQSRRHVSPRVARPKFRTVIQVGGRSALSGIIVSLWVTLAFMAHRRDCKYVPRRRTGDAWPAAGVD